MASAARAGISGASKVEDCRFERGSDDVDGWYDRWIGDSLCGL